MGLDVTAVEGGADTTEPTNNRWKEPDSYSRGGAGGQGGGRDTRGPASQG